MYFDGKSSDLSQCQINMSIAKCLKINVVSRVFSKLKLQGFFKRFTIINEQATRECQQFSVLRIRIKKLYFLTAQNFFDKRA